MFSNKSKDSKGQFGNKFIRNMTVFLLSKKYNTGCLYDDDNTFKHLGIDFVDSIDNECTKIEIMSENKIEEYLNENIIIDMFTNYIFKNVYCQGNNVIKHIVKYFQNSENELCKNIISNNKYKTRYNNNNDIFIHIRAYYFRSLPEIVPGIKFYEKILDSLKDKYDRIYLVSDDIKYIQNNTNLIKKYNITEIKNNNISDIILFGTTCKYVIMSAGSFSFIIGLMSFYSTSVYYSRFAGKNFNNISNLKIWHNNYYPEFKYPKYMLVD